MSGPTDLLIARATESPRDARPQSRRRGARRRVPGAGGLLSFDVMLSPAADAELVLIAAWRRERHARALLVRRLRVRGDRPAHAPERRDDPTASQAQSILSPTRRWNRSAQADQS